MPVQATRRGVAGEAERVVRSTTSSRVYVALLLLIPIPVPALHPSAVPVREPCTTPSLVWMLKLPVARTAKRKPSKETV
jgi:hypothetical protein